MTSVHEEAVETKLSGGINGARPDRAALMAKNVQITFTGKRRMAGVHDVTTFNAPLPLG
jgi:hypothetical protein